MVIKAVTLVAKRRLFQYTTFMESVGLEKEQLLPSRNIPSRFTPEDLDRALEEAEKSLARGEGTESEFEKERFQKLDRIVIRGSAALALHQGKNIEKARDVDIFFVEKEDSNKLQVETFQNLEEAKEKLPSHDYLLIEKALTARGIAHLPIQIVHTSESLLNEFALFEDEPELVLWQPSYAVRAKIIKPIDLDLVDRNSILNTLKRIGFEGYAVREEFNRAQELQLYNSFRLTTGGVPDMIFPKSDRLSTVLRLADIAERFGLQVDDRTLNYANAQAAADTLEIKIPSEEDETALLKDKFQIEAKEPELEEQEDSFGYPTGEGKFKIGEEYVFDTIFYRTIRYKRLEGLLEKRWPKLAELYNKIKSSGGIRKFVKENYGEVYLDQERFNLDSPVLTVSNLPKEEQKSLLGIFFELSYLRSHGFDWEELVKQWEQIRPSSGGTLPSKNLLLKKVGEANLQSPDISVRLRGLSILQEVAEDAIREDNALYLEIRELIRESYFKEKNSANRQTILKYPCFLVTNGDLSLLSDLGQIVRKDLVRLRKGEESNELLGPEGMLALRIIKELNNPEASNLLFELLAVKEFDPRLRKFLLRTATKNQNNNKFGWASIAISTIDVNRPAKEIPWEDYEELYQIEKVPSNQIKNGIRDKAQQAFRDIKYTGHSVAEVRQNLAAGLPPEFFLPLFTKFGSSDDIVYKSWAELLGSIKSQKLKESFHYVLATVLNYDANLIYLITEKIIKSSSYTKEHAILADRLIKKIHFILTAISKIPDPVLTGPGSEAKPKLSIRKLLAESESPALLELKLDEAVLTFMFNLTGRGDLSTAKLQTLFQAWEDPEPIFVYLAELSRSKGMSEQVKHSFELFGEMLAHMDPPNLTEWKEWRYNLENPVVRSQLERLTDEQVVAYAEDEFLELGEVLVSLMPTDKPKRVQEKIIHGLQHDWLNDKNFSSGLVAKLCAGLAERVDNEQNPDREVKARLSRLGAMAKSVETRLAYEEDLSMFDNIAGQLTKWQTAEAEKKRTLVKLGYRGDETSKEIEVKILELQARNAPEKQITQLASLRPSSLPEKTAAFLAKHNLSSAIGDQDLARLKEQTQQALQAADNDPDFLTAKEVMFPGQDQIEKHAWRKAMGAFKASQLLLKLCLLTPQLIAFNKLSPEGKKSSLRPSLDYLKRYFEDNKPILSTLEEIDEVVAERSKSMGKDRLAIIFNDNPLVFLSIGHFPAGAESCQKYSNGSPALTAYMADAYTKNCLMVDLNKLPADVQASLEKAMTSEEKLTIFNSNTRAFLNATVARRLTKIVQNDPEERAELFLEPATYTNLDVSYTSRVMNAFATSYLRTKLGLELKRGGGKETVRVPESRNHMQYEDGESGGPGGGGVGMGSKDGTYIMSAQPLTESDYKV